MEDFKFTLFGILIIGLLGFSGYWAFSTMENGSTHIDNQKQEELEDKNIELEKQVSDLERELSLIEEEKILAEKEQQEIKEKEEEKEAEAPKTETTTPVSSSQTLINDLQKLVDGNIYLKLKSQGPAVGSVQKFLNIYNNTSLRVDNDYGAGTVTRVKNFQKAQGLLADGEAGVNTFKKMISWLKSH